MSGCVYFFKHNNSKYVKIGMSSKNTPIDRFTSFLTYAPLGGELLGYFNSMTPLEDEQAIHEELKDNRFYGEWFEVDFNQIDYFIKKYHQCLEAKRIMFDIPIDLHDEHKNVTDLKCIRTFHYRLYLNTYNQDYDELYNILLKHSDLTEYELKNVDFKKIYDIYFNRALNRIPVETN